MQDTTKKKTPKNPTSSYWKWLYNTVVTYRGATVG